MSCVQSSGEVESGYREGADAEDEVAGGCTSSELRGLRDEVGGYSLGKTWLVGLEPDDADKGETFIACWAMKHQ